MADDPPPLLVLLHDDPPQDYVSDEVDESEAGDEPAANQPLSPSVVFLYLLSPYLRLGAIRAFGFRDATLASGLVGLVVAASLSAFCRHIWFLLGRYLRKSSTEDILIHAFSRRHRRARKHGFARHTLVAISASFKLLLAAMYLRDSVDAVLHLRVSESIPLRSRVNVSIVLSILVFVLSLPRSLAAKSIVYSTGLSAASYLTWLVAVSRSYGAYGLSFSNEFRRGVLWNEISSLTFACTTAMTVPLSASLLAGAPLVSTSRNARTRSFELLNVFSTTLAALFILPLVTFATSPRAPASTATSDDLVLGLRIATLVLSIPSIIVSITSLPSHGIINRFIRTDLVLSIITIVIFALSLVPPAIAGVLDDVTLILAVLGSFLLPALIHITIHYFRRPLSIVVPHEPSSIPGTPSASNSEFPSSPSRDPLLQRKERLLQRSRFGRRLLWDIVIWIVLIPVCACAFVWSVGRLARQW